MYACCIFCFTGFHVKMRRANLGENQAQIKIFCVSIYSHSLEETKQIIYKIYMTLFFKGKKRNKCFGRTTYEFDWLNVVNQRRWKIKCLFYHHWFLGEEAKEKLGENQGQIPESAKKFFCVLFEDELWITYITRITTQIVN